jgi:hypothetical protein
MKDIRQGICPLCEHNQIIESKPIDYVHGDLSYPAAVTYDMGWFSERMKPSKPHGLLRRYVCQRCGFCQTFALAPETIPVDEAHETRIIEGPAPATPSR